MDPLPLFSPSLQPQKEKVIRSIFADISNKSDQENPKKLRSQESKIKQIRAIFENTNNAVNQKKESTTQPPGSVKHQSQSSPDPHPRTPESPKSSCHSDGDVHLRTPSPTISSKKESTQQSNNDNSNFLPVSPPARKSCTSDTKSHYSEYSSTDTFYSAQSGISPVKMALSPKLLSPRAKSKYSFEYVSKCNSQDELEQIVKTLESQKHNRYQTLLKAACKRLNHVREMQNDEKCSNMSTPHSRDTNLNTTHESSLIMSLSTTAMDDLSTDSSYFQRRNQVKLLNGGSHLGSVVIEGLNKVDEGFSTDSSKKEEQHLTQQIETLTKRIHDLQLAKYEQETLLNKKVCDLEHARKVAESNVHVLEQAVKETNEAAETIRMSMAEIQDERDTLRESLEMQKEKQRQYSDNVESTQAELRTQIDSLSKKLESEIDLGPVLEELETRAENEAALNVSLEETKLHLQAVQQEQASMLSVLETAMYGDAALTQSFDKEQGRKLISDVSQKLASSKLAVKAFAEAMSSTELDRQEVKDKLKLAETRIQELKRFADDLERENATLHKQNMNLTKQLEEVKLLSENRKKQEEQYEHIIQHLRKTISKKENVVSLSMYKSAQKEADDLLLQVKDRDAQIDALQSNLLALQQNLNKTNQMQRYLKEESVEHVIPDQSDKSIDNDPNRTYDLIELVKRNLDQAETRSNKHIPESNFQDCFKPMGNEFIERLTPAQQFEPHVSHRVSPESSEEQKIENVDKMRDPPSSSEKSDKRYSSRDVELSMQNERDDLTLPSIIEHQAGSLSSSPPFSVSHLTSPILASPTARANFYAESPPIFEKPSPPSSYEEGTQRTKLEPHESSSIEVSPKLTSYYERRYKRSENHENSSAKCVPHPLLPERLEPQGEISFVDKIGRNGQLPQCESFPQSGSDRNATKNIFTPLRTSHTVGGSNATPQRSRHWFFLTIILASTNLYLILNQSNSSTAPLYSLEASSRKLRTNDEFKADLNVVEDFTPKNDDATRISMSDMSFPEQPAKGMGLDSIIDPDRLGRDEEVDISKVIDDRSTGKYYSIYQEDTINQDDGNTGEKKENSNNESINEDSLAEEQVSDDDYDSVEDLSESTSQHQLVDDTKAKELDDVTDELVRKRAIELFLNIKEKKDNITSAKQKRTNGVWEGREAEQTKTNNYGPLDDATDELVRERAIDLFLKMKEMNDNIISEKHKKRTNDVGEGREVELTNTNNYGSSVSLQEQPTTVVQKEETSAAKQNSETTPDKSIFHQEDGSIRGNNKKQLPTAEQESEIIRHSFKKIMVIHHDEEDKNKHNMEEQSRKLLRNNGHERRKKHNFFSRIFSRKGIHDDKNNGRGVYRKKRKEFLTNLVRRVKSSIQRALRNKLQQLEHKIRSKLQQLENGL